MKMKWKPEVQQATFPVYYFNVWLLDGQEKVQVDQVADIPPESTEANSSVLIFHLDTSGKHGIGFHITWFPYKPVPESAARRAGLLTVLKDIYNRLPEESKAFFENQMLGIGHADGAKAVIHEEDNDAPP